MKKTGTIQFLKRMTAALAVVVTWWGNCAQAQGDQVAELELAVEALQRQNAELKAELEKAKETENEPAIEEALAAANEEADRYRELYKNLLIQVEALGLDSIRSDDSLRERLIKAVREREMFEARNDAAAEQLLSLSEAIMDYLKTSSSSDPEARLRVEAELRAADEILGFGAQKKLMQEVDVNDGRVISYKDEYRLAVLNIGSRSGARVGMPLNIMRKDRLVGVAVVVDVRDAISGAVVQEIFGEGDQVMVRDRVKPRTVSLN